MEQNIEDKLLIAKLQDKIKQCKIRNKIVNTEFLNLHQKKLIQNKLNEFKIKNYIFHGGFEEAENQVLIIYPEKLTEEIVLNAINNIINAIKITLPNEQVGEYEHRDYLSAVMRLGLERERIGDIIVYKNEAYIISLKENVQYIADSLKEFTRFKKSQIEIISIDEIKSKTPEFMQIEIHVSSNRLDSIVAEIARTSRSKAEELIKNERVSINCKYEYKSSKTVNIGDIIIVRGSGKYILENIKENQKTKRFTIILQKYIWKNEISYKNVIYFLNVNGIMALDYNLKIIKGSKR